MHTDIVIIHEGSLVSRELERARGLVVRKMISKRDECPLQEDAIF